MSKGEGGASASPTPLRIEGFISSLNYPTGKMAEQAKANARKGLPWIDQAEPHDRTMILVGGGPSLRENMLSLRMEEGDVFAMNGTHDYLVNAGITPHGMIILDSRPDNARFVSDPQDGTTYYVSAVCHEDVLSALEGHDVKLWANTSEATEGVGSPITINGGSTVGLKAMCLGYALGYRKFSLYGYDSCYRLDDGHAYPQNLNDGETINETWVGGRKFFCAPWMAKQGSEFIHTVKTFQAAGCHITLTGDGLIPEIARVMAGGKTDLSVDYDLGTCPASFDFLVWLANADAQRRAMGCDKLRIRFLAGPKDGFRNDDLPGSAEFKRQMLENVIKPAVELMPGAEIGGEGESGASVPYTTNFATLMAENGVMPGKFVAPVVPEVDRFLNGRKPIVVTLRESSHWPGRNSNVGAWQKFAEGRDVVFVRDTDNAAEPLPGCETFPLASTDLHARAALYASASVVMGVANGPLALATFSDIPFLAFTFPVDGYPVHEPERWEAITGVKWGDQFPWLTPSQRIVYQRDSLDNILNAYTQWKDTACS